MKPLDSPSNAHKIGLPQALAWVGFSAICFYVAQLNRELGFLSVGSSVGLLQLGRVASSRSGFYLGCLAGLAFYVPQMGFLVEIFGAAAAPLWMILAIWVGLFGWIHSYCSTAFGIGRAAILAPFVWTAFEYFRSEVYWLRFSWFCLGTAWEPSEVLLPTLGIYGAGFWSMAIGACIWVALVNFGNGTWKSSLKPAIGLVILSVVPWLFPKSSAGTNPPAIRVAAMQLEFPGEPQVLAGLNAILKSAPQTDLIVLSEYTFDGPVPHNVLKWCRTHSKWLIAGGKVEMGPHDGGAVSNEGPEKASRPLGLGAPGEKPSYYNTAFVVGPTGEVVFQQAKSVPIQFFKDGLPAKTQSVWESPWGRIGIAICYDASYRRVMDELVRQGAQALIVPAMDVEQWGQAQHELNARAMRVRCQEYGLPAFRVASSGFSQVIDRSGRELARAGFPGQEEILTGELSFVSRGRIPIDRFLPLPCLIITGLIVLRRVLDDWARRRVALTKTDSA